MVSKAKNRRPGDRLGRWTLKEKIGAGGNGDVWSASEGDSVEATHAIKLLRRLRPSTLGRFEAELAALERAKTIKGVVPVVDIEHPKAGHRSPRWYVMPIGKPLSITKQSKDPVASVRAFAKLAETLVELHKIGIYHRDIKPANILELGGRLCLSDFGLATFPEKPDQTPANTSLGPRSTIAPEMRWDATSADGESADVYSFIKTLWIILTGRETGFDGQYHASTAVGLIHVHPSIYTAPLDDLFHRGTEHHPTARPKMAEVARQLTDWLALQDDFHRRNLSEWLSLQNSLFPTVRPATARWTDRDSIIEVLRTVSRVQALNHMFLPSGGGFDLENIQRSSEPGCIELTAGWAQVLAPEFLSYESFGRGSVWSYFWLEASTIEEIGIEDAYVDENGFREQLCELTQGSYAGLEAWERGELDGRPLPETTRRVTRWLRGAFVIFAKRSWYNLAPQTYDARHQKLGYERFRSEIAEAAKRHPDAPPR